MKNKEWKVTLVQTSTEDLNIPYYCKFLKRSLIIILLSLMCRHKGIILKRDKKVIFVFRIYIKHINYIV